MEERKHSDPAIELIMELRSLESAGTALAPFDSRRTQDVVSNIKELQLDLDNLGQNQFFDPKEPYFASLPIAIRARIQREKRCLTAYLLWRLNNLRGLWWDSRDHEVSQRVGTSHATEAEKEYLRGYNDVMCNYMRTFEVPLDLRAFTSRPPSYPPMSTVEVCGIKDHVFVSPIVFSTVKIRKGIRKQLAFEDAENLIQQGIVEIVSNNT